MIEFQLKQYEYTVSDICSSNSLFFSYSANSAGRILLTLWLNGDFGLLSRFLCYRKRVKVMFWICKKIDGKFHKMYSRVH